MARYQINFRQTICLETNNFFDGCFSKGLLLQDADILGLGILNLTLLFRLFAGIVNAPEMPDWQ